MLSIAFFPIQNYTSDMGMLGILQSLVQCCAALCSAVIEETVPKVPPTGR